jgi:hypothetical protein
MEYIDAFGTDVFEHTHQAIGIVVLAGAGLTTLLAHGCQELAYKAVGGIGGRLARRGTLCIRSGIAAHGRKALIETGESVYHHARLIALW